MVTDVLPPIYIHCMTEDLNQGLSNSGQMLYTRVIKCADTEKSVSDTILNWKLLLTFRPNAPVETSQKVFQLQVGI